MKWTTRDGRRIDLADMTIEHLRAAIAMVERTRENFYDPEPMPMWPAGLHGDMAQMYAEQEFNIAMDDWLEDGYSHELQLMREELARRERERSRRWHALAACRIDLTMGSEP